ncbi:MAG TPA: GntR family transcriptional regulator [Anaerolineales bacterium]|nr:GntR family transcriptional regulator [Anaerolineales bacterium]
MRLDIDRSSPIPLYVQLASWLEKEIADSRFDIGARLPAEMELATLAGLNRNTVRHALASLAEKGLLATEKGRGTFVRRKQVLHPIRQLGRLTSFVDDFDLSDVLIEDVTLSKEKARAKPDLAKKLMISAGEPVVRIERLRIADKTPFVLERQYYTYRDFGRLLDIELKGSMYRLLTAQFRADLHHSAQTVRAVRPLRDVAQKLGIRQDVPCLFLESLAYTEKNTCIEVLESYYRGDRYAFKVETGQYRRDMHSAVRAAFSQPAPELG